MFDIFQKGYKPPKKNPDESENIDDDIFIQVYIENLNWTSTVIMKEWSPKMKTVVCYFPYVLMPFQANEEIVMWQKRGKFINL